MDNLNAAGICKYCNTDSVKSYNCLSVGIGEEVAFFKTPSNGVNSAIFCDAKVVTFSRELNDAAGSFDVCKISNKYGIYLLFEVSVVMTFCSDCSVLTLADWSFEMDRMLFRVVSSEVTFWLPTAETRPVSEFRINDLFEALSTRLVRVARIFLAVVEEVKLACMILFKVDRVEFSSFELTKIFSSAEAEEASDLGMVADILSKTAARSVFELIAVASVENKDMANVLGIDVFIRVDNASKVAVTLFDFCNSSNAGSKGAISAKVRLDSATSDAEVFAGCDESVRREKAVFSKEIICVELKSFTCFKRVCR